MKNRQLLHVFAFFIFFFVFATKNYSTTNLPDSIVQVTRRLERGVPDNEKIRLLRSLSIYYKDHNSVIAQAYGKQYLNLAIQTNALMHQGFAHTYLAKTYRDQLDIEKSLYHNMESLKMFEKIGDTSSVLNQWLNLSDNYLFLNKYDSALFYYRIGYDLATRINDTSKQIYAELQVGKVYSFKDRNIEAKEKLEAAISLAELINHDRNIGWASYWLGFTNMKLGNFDLAKANFARSYEIYEMLGDGFGMIGPAQELGELYLKMGRYAEAYRWFFKGMQNMHYIPGARSEMSYQSTHYLNMGKVQFSINDFDHAMAFFDTAMIVATKNNFTPQIAIASTNIGRVHFRKEAFEQALASYNLALDYYKARNSKFGIADLLNKIGGVYEHSARYSLAISYYTDALAINEEIGNKFGIAQNHINLASVYNRQGNWKRMGYHLDAGIDYARLTQVNPLILRYYGYYINYCELTHDHQEAHNFFNSYLPLSQKVNEDNITNLSTLLVEMHKNELDKRNASYEQDLSLKKLKSERDHLRINQMLLIVIVVALFALVAGLMFYIKFRTARKLERLVEARTKELKENEQKLIEVNETREKFYSIIAHDLKSPFNSLIGFSNLLLDDYDDFSDKERREFVEIIRNSSENIFDLLENLLDWTRRSTNDFALKPVKLDLNILAKRAIQLQEKNASIKQISVINKIPKNTFALADENIVAAILRNLISNAIKFTNPGGEIIFRAEVKDGSVFCSVEDNGLGMSEDVQQKILDKDNLITKKGTGKEKGTGLGLRLVSDFVERSGGKFTIESAIGEGSRFTFTLPVK